MVYHSSTTSSSSCRSHGGVYATPTNLMVQTLAFIKELIELANSLRFTALSHLRVMDNVSALIFPSFKPLFLSLLIINFCDCREIMIEA